MTESEKIIIDMAKVMKSVSFYPEGHPALSGALGALASSINDTASKDVLAVEVTKDSFMVRNTSVPAATPVLREFAQSLVLRRVNKLLFKHGVDADELYALLQVLGMELSNIISAGGMENVLAANGIVHIGLSEKHLEKLQEARKHEAGAADAFMEMQQQVGAVAQAGQPLPEAQPQQKKAEEIWTGLKHKLQMARDAGDIGEYLTTLRNVDAMLQHLTLGRDTAIVLNAYLTLIQHHNDLTTMAGMKKSIGEMLNAHFSRTRINGLIDLYIDYHEDATIAASMHKVFGFIGEDHVISMVDKLGMAKDVKTRKILMNELSRTDILQYPNVLAFLDDERWFVVRNIVTLLGAGGRKDAIRHLAKVSRHPDLRVRKEVVKALARIQDQRASSFLRDMLSREGEEVQQLVVFSLGISRDRGAIAAIQKLLDSDASMRVKREALVALGRIGGDDVLPILKSQAKRFVFFKKAANKQLRLAAIAGLGEHATEAAKTFLEKLERSGDPDIRDAATEALQKIRYKSAT